MKDIFGKNRVSYVDRPPEEAIPIKMAYRVQNYLRGVKYRINILLGLVSFFIRNYRNIQKLVQQYEQKMHDAKFGQKIEEYNYWKGFVDGLKFTIK